MTNPFKKIVALCKEAAANIKRYSEKNRIKTFVQQHVPAEYQSEAMARLMQVIDAHREDKIRITRKIIDDIQNRISRDMDAKLETARRRREFGKVTELADRLPEEFRQDAIVKLSDIADLPRTQRKERIAEIFVEIQSTIERRFEDEISAIKVSCSQLKRKMQERFLSPECPYVEIYPNYENLLEKTKATFALSRLHQEYDQILKPNPLLYVTAVLGITFSLVGTYLTFTSRLGDWVGGNETVSIAANALLSLAFNVLEATALFMVLSFLPEKYAHGVSRMIGIAGAVLLVASVVVVICMRSEIGTSIAESVVKNMGSVQ
jgi:hypothetical protein